MRNEAERDYHRRWRAANPERCREYSKRWREKVKNTPEYKAKVAEQNRKWRERHVNDAEFKAKKLAWQQQNPERTRMSSLKHRLARRAAMIEAYGAKCACCGESEPLFLTLDHINKNGAEERRAFKTSHNAGVVARLQREGWPQGEYRLLCWNCQYGHYRGVCPHQVAA